jgi:diguanylate cyclase (GGDEF)-like protein
MDYLNHIEEKKAEIRRSRQLVSIKIYAFLFVFGSLGIMPALFFNPLLTNSQRITYAFMILGFVLLVAGALFFCYRAKHLLKTVDFILFMINVLVYFLVLTTSPNMKFLNVAIWLPICVVFNYTLKNKIYTLLFMVTHTLITLYYFLEYPTFNYLINVGTYTNVLAVGILLTISLYFLINQNNSYEAIMFDDYVKLENNNMELTALNEEYYASQEELMSQYDEIQYLAYHDTLTDLLNRSGFINEMASKLASNTDYYTVILDIAKFNQINNVYGFELGDYILKGVSKILKDMLPDHAVLSRIGDDVFIFSAECCESMDHLIENLKSLDRTVNFENIRLNLKYNFGIIKCSQKSLTPEDVIKQAEVALLKAKTLEKLDYCIYEPSLLEMTKKKVRLHTDLEKALNDKTLYMNYQPIYHTETREINSFEALTRWIHPEQGYIPPNEFIELAESSILIHQLGQNVIDSVSAFIKTLEKENLHNKFSRITINVSSKELARKEYAQAFIEYFNTLNIDPSYIGIEVTETVIIENIDTAISSLKTLSKKGFKIYLDDFGTGYSSLSYLDSLPIDVLKIDKSFVDKISKDHKKKMLLKSIVSMAQSLNIETVAEGVETDEEYHILKDMNVEFIQGYYLSKPVTENQVIELLMETE